MTQTIPMEAPTADELNHHGILGMKWGVRRFQKYPKGYSGDGKYVGPDGQPRQPTKKEAKRDRKYNELKSKIDKWLVDAVETGDKKALKRLKKTMTPQEYQAAYGNLVKTAVSNAVKEGDRKAIKTYKKDLTKKELKEATLMADFNDAVNKMDTDKMNKLVSKIKNEDLKDAATRIATMTELQKKKIDSLKVESEMSAKLEKVGKTVSNVATIAKKGKDIYDAVTGVMDSIQKREQASKELADKLNAENQKKEIDKVIKKGNEKEFEKIKEKMSNEQIKAFYERQYLKNKKAIDKAILTGDAKTKDKYAHLISNAPVETLNKATTKDKHNNESGAKDIKDESVETLNKDTHNNESGAKGVKGETVGKKAVEPDYQQTFTGRETNEEAVNKDKWNNIYSKIEKTQNENKSVTLDSLKAMRAYGVLSNQKFYSDAKIEEARQIVKAFESSGGNVVKADVTTMADAIKSGTTANVKENLDRIFSSVDDDNPNYYINGVKVKPPKKK